MFQEIKGGVGWKNALLHTVYQKGGANVGVACHGFGVSPVRLVLVIRQMNIRNEREWGRETERGRLACVCTHPLRARWLNWPVCFEQKQRQQQPQHCHSRPYRNPRSLLKPGPNPHSLQTGTHSHSPTALEKHTRQGMKKEGVGAVKESSKQNCCVRSKEVINQWVFRIEEINQ